MNELAPAAGRPGRDSAPTPDGYQIGATRSLVDRTLRTLKQDDLFGVFDKQGDCRAAAGAPDGLYFHDTRFLSGLTLTIGGGEPLLLGSVVLDDNSAMMVDLANADLHDDAGRIWLQRDTVHALRTKFLSETCCFERIRLRAYGPLGRPLPVELAFNADFADLFEVRGESRPRRGSRKVATLDNRTVRFRYAGLDHVQRETVLHFDPPPDRLDAHKARWLVDLDAVDRTNIVVRIACSIGDVECEPPRLVPAWRALRRARRGRQHGRAGIDSSNELFNAVIDRSAADVDMLITDTEYGPYPYAGIPWYSTIFGRDGLITAFEMLWTAPAIARGVLRALALTQATEVDPAADAEPGKILHEMRGGEMARLGEVPFRRYYGSVDATPLFVMLAGDYLKRTGDLDTIREIWPNLRAALDWIEGPGDGDGDGLVEYQRMTGAGLANQGWKDSFDAVFHEDGSDAEGPIALCEVQAYAYGARRGAARIARALGEIALASRLDGDAQSLRDQFEAQFWMEDRGCYALALDGRKQPCRVLTSNAGHALFAGIASPERAARMARLLVSPDFFTGWGVRTVASGEARYNPMSYHNGSVWPHDNALIALGLCRYGHKEAVLALFTGLIEAATHEEFHRLPELFCGFARRRNRGPTSYPVACAPQAWAAAAPFALVAAAAGLDLDHAAGTIRLATPRLPPFLDTLALNRLAVAGSAMDLKLCRAGDDVSTAVENRSGRAGLVIVK